MQFGELCMTGILRTWQAELLLGQVSFIEVCEGIPREMMHGKYSLEWRLSPGIALATV